MYDNSDVFFEYLDLMILDYYKEKQKCTCLLLLLMKADLNYKLILIIFLLKIYIMDFLAERSYKFTLDSLTADPGGPNTPSLK